MSEELFEYAEHDEEPALREWYFPDDRMGHHGGYKFAFIGKRSRNRFKDQAPIELNYREQANAKLKILHEAWKKADAMRKHAAAANQAKKAVKK